MEKNTEPEDVSSDANKMSPNSFLHENLFLYNIQCLFFHTESWTGLPLNDRSQWPQKSLQTLCLRLSTTYIAGIIYHPRFLENLNSWCFFTV